MRGILRIDCSPRGEASYSRRLADEMLAELSRTAAMTSFAAILPKKVPRLVDASFTEGHDRAPDRRSCS